MIKSNSDRVLPLSISSFLTPPAAKNSSAPPLSEPSKFSPRHIDKTHSQHPSNRPLAISYHNNIRSDVFDDNFVLATSKRRSKKRGRSRKIYGSNSNNVVSISIDDSDGCAECSRIYYVRKGDENHKASEDTAQDEQSDHNGYNNVSEGGSNAENFSPRQFITKSPTTRNLTSTRQRISARKSSLATKKMAASRTLRRAKSSEDDREDPYLISGGSCINLPPHRYSVVDAGVEGKDSSTDTSFAFRNSKFNKAPTKKASPIYRHQQTDTSECCSTSEIVTINVSGLRFQTFDSTLSRYPSSLLGNPMKRRKYWNEEYQEYFLDRHRTTFEAILHIYQTFGQVIRPESVPISLFLRELSFYELGNEVLENFWASEGYQKPAGDILPKNRWQRIMWQLMEFPDSSILARILAFVSVSVIIISIVSFCLETLPELKRENEVNSREWSSPFFWIEFSCCLWFSVELFVRFVSSPSKSQFMKSFLNVLDFVAVAPFFTNLLWMNTSMGSISTSTSAPLMDPTTNAPSAMVSSSSLSFSVLRIIRLVRVFRIFKLSRHSVGLQVLGKTFKASVQEFCLLIFFMGIALILFSSGVYFAEQNEPDTKFTSIPASFWFVLATMTTVGYGDLVPHGVYGKIVGSCCALIGVLTLALPVPIIVANFKHFYRQECRLAQIYRQQQQILNNEVKAKLSDITQNGKEEDNALPLPQKTLLIV